MPNCYSSATQSFPHLSLTKRCGSVRSCPGRSLAAGKWGSNASEGASCTDYTATWKYIYIYIRLTYISNLHSIIIYYNILYIYATYHHSTPNFIFHHISMYLRLKHCICLNLIFLGKSLWLSFGK